MKKSLSLILIFVLLLSGCRPLSKNNETGDNSGGEIFLQMRIPDTLDPINVNQETVREILGIVYEPLFLISENSLEPRLATGYNINSSKNITVFLKDGVFWHDGSSFGASDVLYTVNKIKNSPNSIYYQNVKDIEKVDIISQNEVVFSLSRDYALFPYLLTFPIVKQAENIGTGSYFIADHSTRQTLTLERFSSYHGGNALVEKINVHLLKDGLTATDSFLSRSVDAVTSSVFDLENTPRLPWMDFDFMMSDCLLFLGFNTNSPTLSSELVRSSISMSINRDEIISNYFPEGKKAVIPLSPELISSELSSYNTEYASELLFLDGFSKNGSVYQKQTEEGVLNLDLRLLVSDDATLIEVAKLIGEQLKSVGFNVVVDSVPFEEATLRIESGEFDMYLGKTVLKSLYDGSYLLVKNPFGYFSESMNQALNDLFKATDEGSRKSALFQVQTVFEREYPISGLLFLSDCTAFSSRIKKGGKKYLHNPYADINLWSVDNNYK